MSDDPVTGDSTSAEHALQIAFQTMQERCQQLENRLAAVEEENVRLKVEKGTNSSLDVLIVDVSDEEATIQRLQEKVEELTKQKSQLSHHILMVAAENRQLWNRLTRLTRTNKTLGSKLIKISDTLKQHPAGQALETSNSSIKDVPNVVEASQNPGGTQGDASLEEISLRLINSIMMEKVELDSASKKVCQTGTQFDSDDSLREDGTTQTSLPTAVSLESGKVEGPVNQIPDDVQICPMCGAFFGKSVPFEIFHEHVLSHFSTGSVSNSEMLP
ncbi:uncharacterized protein spn-F [Fopius arisanus]|uniref:Uncharacterized protein spn-F n=1 Tax=Fopius arisanus TaxID=64838 RepID=A0A9R1UA32_9HYME|nr:PREDICTED: uncharacterized protein LOC105272567 [Fopius arisanus]